MQHVDVVIVIDVNVGLPVIRTEGVGNEVGPPVIKQPHHLLKQPRKHQKRMSGFVMSGFESCLTER